MFAAGIARMPGLKANRPQTNIVQVDVGATAHDASWWVTRLEQQGVLVRAWAGSLLRCVTHRHLGDEDVAAAVDAFAGLAAV